MGRIFLLTLPGWSNVDSWLPVVREMRKVTGNIFVSILSAQPWVFENLSPRDKFGLDLDTLGVVFDFYLDDFRSVRLFKFSTARAFGKWLNYCSALDRAIRADFFTYILVAIFSRLGRAAVSHDSFHFSSRDVVLSDVDIFSSHLNPRDLEFVRHLRGAHFASLFHGTLLLQQSRPLIHKEMLSDFLSVTAFATSEAQVNLYARDYLGSCKIVKVGPPRFEQERPLERKVDQPPILLFLMRNPQEFKGFSTYGAIKSLTQIIRLAAISSKALVILKPHPNQSRLQVLLIFSLVKCWCALTRHHVAIGYSVSDHLGNPNAMAVSWFSGVLLDFVARGQNAFEVRGGEDLSGPIPEENEHWDGLWRAGLVQRVTTKSQISAVLSAAGAGNLAGKADNPLRKHFFDEDGSASKVAAHLLSLVNRL